jgi:hypothetical protein
MRNSVLVAISLMIVSACAGSASSPAAPSATMAATVTNLSGSWTGTSVDSTGRETMAWIVNQTGNAMSGTMSIADSNRNMMGSGSMQGTVSGSTVVFHMTVPAGGFNGTMSPCSMLVDGQGQMSADGHTMTGTYAGNMSGMMSGMMSSTSCGGAMSSGQFTMTR